MKLKNKTTKSIAIALIGASIVSPLCNSVYALQGMDEVNSEEKISENNSVGIESVMRSSIDMENKIKKRVLSKGYSSIEEYNSQIGQSIPIEESIYYNNFEYYATPLPETIENSSERAIQLWSFAKAAWSVPWVRGTVTNFGKAILAGAEAQIGANIVNDTREVMKNGLPKVSTHSSSNIVGDGKITRGDKVRLAQTLLRQHGYNIAVDGIWGPASKDAAKKFQKRLNMSTDGLIGKHTWAYLIEHLK